MDLLFFIASKLRLQLGLKPLDVNGRSKGVVSKPDDESTGNNEDNEEGVTVFLDVEVNGYFFSSRK